MTTDLKTNYEAETNASDVEKLENRRKQDFEDDANNISCDWQRILNEGRSNLNCKHLSTTHALNILILLIVFKVFNKLTSNLWRVISVKIMFV